MADWASIPYDLLVLIVTLVKKFQDFSAFASVCKSWHAAASKDRFKAFLLRDKTPYLMLPADNGGNIRDLYSLAEGEVVASVRFPNSSETSYYESLGWFLAVDKDGSMCLFDPFSRTEIPLPNLNTLPQFEHDDPYSVKKMVLSARPSDPTDPSDFSVALLFMGFNVASFWMPGENSWHTSHLPWVYRDIIYHAGTFYYVDDNYRVDSFCFLTDTTINRPLLEVDYVIGPPYSPGNLCTFKGMSVYIVKVLDSLLLVTRTFLSGCGRTTKFEVYEFYFSSNTWIKINNLANMALFLGSGSATTIVDASRFPDFLKANHIYFTDDVTDNPFGDFGEPREVTGQDMGVYNLENGMIDPFYDEEAFTSKISHPAWILPFLWS